MAVGDKIGGAIVLVQNQLNRMGKGESVAMNAAGGLTGNGVSLEQCPVTLSVDGVTMKLPIDPVMSVGGHNVVVRRNVAKGGTMHGSIKETWREDDLKVTIAGVLRSDERKTVEDYVGNLLQICQSGSAVVIDCDYLRDAFGITRFVIEDYDFPSTKGLDSQQYSIKGYSDDSYELLEEL